MICCLKFRDTINQTINRSIQQPHIHPSIQTTSPQEIFKKNEKEKAEAGTWREEHASTRAATTQAASGWPKHLGKMPKVLDLEKAREFVVRRTGCRLWHEPQTDRIRGSYIVGEGKRITRSAAVQGDQGAAARWVLQWMWALHKDVAGEACPFEGL